jgi:signal transduction histidine kinase/DNA-binding response OmpR family regulator
MAKESVLVVDDEEHARNAVTRLLTANGYTVKALASGEEALEYATTHIFEVLLSDFRMPGLDGLTTIRVIRKINPQVVAIIMTGNTSIELAVQSLNLGVHGFVVKPFHGYELLNTIERTLERQNLIRENIRMKALVDVFATTEALISANDSGNNEKRLVQQTLEFTIRETEATDAALFLFDNNEKLEVEAIAYKQAGEGESRITSLAMAEAEQAELKNKNDTIIQVYMQPNLQQRAFYKKDDWQQVQQHVQATLEAETTLFFIDGKQTDVQTARYLTVVQPENCLLTIPMLAQGRKVGVLCARRRKTGDCFSDVHVQIAAILAGQSAIAIDNSRLLQRLVQIEALREADRLRSEFVSTVSHELRTPLTSIKGYATTLLRPDVKWNETSGRDYLNIISDECDKLMSLIDNILEVSKIEAGVFRVYPEPIQLGEMIAYTVTEARRRSPEAIIKNPELPLDQELPLVMADTQRIIQVIRNLISNSIKYSIGQAEVSIRLHPITETSGEDFVQIDITDKGLGLSAQHAAKVFERFYRVDVGAARKTEGTGLGLAICKGIIEAHGGRIWVESPGPELGSTFSFTLPVVKMDWQTLAD